MKALLRKDLYVMVTQFKILILMLVVFSAIPDGRFIPFSLLYSVMLSSVSLMSIDESSQWDSLALMLPWSRRTIVAERYVFGWLGLALALALSVAFQMLWAAVGVQERMGPEFPGALCVYVAVALLFQVVTCPVNFRFGCARGRIVSLIIMGAAGGFLGFMMASAPEAVFTSVMKLVSRFHPAAFPFLAAALCAATIPLSVKGYEKRVTR